MAPVESAFELHLTRTWRMSGQKAGPSSSLSFFLSFLSIDMKLFASSLSFLLFFPCFFSLESIYLAISLPKDFESVALTCFVVPRMALISVSRISQRLWRLLEYTLGSWAISWSTVMLMSMSCVTLGYTACTCACRLSQNGGATQTGRRTLDHATPASPRRSVVRFTFPSSSIMSSRRTVSSSRHSFSDKKEMSPSIVFFVW